MQPYTQILATKRDMRALPVCLCLLTFLFWAMIECGMSVGFGMVWLAFAGGAFLYLRGACERETSAATRLFFIASVVFTPIFAITDWWALAFTVFLVQLCSLLFWITFASGHGGGQGRLADLLIAIARLFESGLVGAFEYGEGISTYLTVRKAEQTADQPKKRPFPWGIVGGILLSLPVLGVLIPLLTNADAAFDGVMGKLSDSFWSGVTSLLESIGTLVLALILAAVFFYPVTATLFSVCRAPKKRESIQAEYLPGTMLIGFYGSIVLLCLVYLFSQLSYLFNGFLGLLPEELTAAEYARRGFFEIFTFSLLSLGIIAVGVLLAKRDRLYKLFGAFVCFLCGFNILLIATAFAKMVLYVKLYGLTVKRLTVAAILLLLGVIFITVILRRIFPRFKSLPVVLVAALLLFGALGFADPHRMVAEYNVSAWESGRLEMVDLELLADLSDAAIPAMIRVAESEDDRMAEQAYCRLQQIYLRKCSDYEIESGAMLPVGDGALTYRLSEHIANRELNRIKDKLMELCIPSEVVA